MSSRALRKAQFAKEEQERLQKLERDAHTLGEEEQSEEDVYIQPTKKSAFALLQDEDDALEDPESDDEDATIAETPEAPAIQEPVSKKKKKKKGKKKANTSGDQTISDGLDEIDAALKELSANGKASESAATASGVDEAVNEANRLLSIDSHHLHLQNEMRRLFGRAALPQEEEPQPLEGAVEGNRRQLRRARQVGLAQLLREEGPNNRSGRMSTIALRRNIFIQGRENWPVAMGSGLGMEVEEKHVDGTVLYRFVHSNAYQDVQSQFETCVASMDPQRLIALLRLNPYHISTLLQVSEIAKQESDHATSGELLERALFSFGRTVHSTFAKNLAEGKARLDFRRAENREFWLASWRHIQNLTMRGMWRTVYEWTKLLLSLAPQDDPYGLWLVLDQNAVRSRQDLDFLNISRNLTFKKIHHDMPNIQISQGLAEFRAGNQGKGKQALFTAFGKFPWAITRLMQELNLDPPPAIWGQEPRSSREKLYAELYATRAKDLWNTSEASNLLVEVASALPPDTPAAPIDADAITRREARHVILSDTPALIALIPRKLSSQLDSSSDPLPPDDAFTSYLSRRAEIPRGGGGQASIEQLEESVREIQDLGQFFRELFPWFRRPIQVDDDRIEYADSAGDQIDVPADHEALMRHVEQAGVSRQDFGRRLNRFNQLQHQLLGGAGVGAEASGYLEARLLPGGFPVDLEDVEELRPYQARVEDAPDVD